MAAIAGLGIPAWLSYSIAGGRTCAGQVRQWMAAGARIAGGCCRIRPADIAVIARAAADAGHAPAD